jgi:lipoprotein-releasing system permease protein
MVEYDSALAYITLADAQRFFDLGDAVTGVEVRTVDLEHAPGVAAAINDVAGFSHRVRDWQQMNLNLFSAIKLEKTVYFIVLLLIVLVAAFNIVATLVMVVMEKRKDIAVLKSMGATRTAIAQIFIYKGLVIGGVGTLAGSVLGLALCELLRRYGFPLPQGVFYVSTVPVKIYPEYFALVIGASLAICLFATLYPARQASRLVPAEAIRYD